ncbi:MAG: hypothetical protein WA823_04745 [Candidatus Acidiferrales bacterium]
MAASVAMTASGGSVFRNNKFALALVEIVGAIIILGSVAVFAACVYKEFHTPDGFGHRLVTLAILLAGFLVALLMGILLCVQGIVMADYEVRFNPDGLRLRLGTKTKPNEMLFPWDQIEGVYFRRGMNTMYGSVKGKDGQTSEFSSYTFFRTKKLVSLIAERAGPAIQEQNA